MVASVPAAVRAASACDSGYVDRVNILYGVAELPGCWRRYLGRAAAALAHVDLIRYVEALADVLGPKAPALVIAPNTIPGGNASLATCSPDHGRGRRGPPGSGRESRG